MKKNFWIIDALALIGFLLALKPQITGYTVHEWLGLAVGLVCLVHLIQHWHWVVSISKIMDRVKAKIRIRFTLDLMMATGVMTIIVSGLVISSLLSLNLLNYDTWRIVHVASSFVTLVLLIWKIALHWDLIKGTVARAFSHPEKREALTSEQLSRRRFLKDAGFASLGLLVVAGGLSSVLNNMKTVTAEESTQTVCAIAASLFGKGLKSEPYSHPIFYVNPFQ